MTCTLTGNLDDYVAIAGGFLRSVSQAALDEGASHVVLFTRCRRQPASAAGRRNERR